MLSKSIVTAFRQEEQRQTRGWYQNSVLTQVRREAFPHLRVLRFGNQTSRYLGGVFSVSFSKGLLLSFGDELPCVWVKHRNFPVGARIKTRGKEDCLLSL